MLVPMAKIEIYGPKALFLEVIQCLHEQGSVHIEDLTKQIQSGDVALDRMQVDPEEQRVYDELDETLVRVRSILKTLKAPEGGIDAAARTKEYDRLWSLSSDELCRTVQAQIDQIEDRTSQLAQTHTQLESENALLERYLPVLSKVQPLAKQVVITGSYDTTALLVERRYKTGLEALKQELSKITHNQCEIVSTDVDEETTAAIVVYAKKYAESVHKFLATENVNQIRLPSDFQDMPLDVAYENIKLRQSELPTQLNEIRGELDTLSRDWYLKLAAARSVLTDRLDEIQAIPKFGSTQYAFMIQGWVPASDFGKLEDLLKQNFQNQVVVNQLEVDEKDFESAPVAMKNVRWAEPYQQLLGFMGTPTYGTYDPTWMLAIFYPLFFGMIVGDIGYGLIMLATVLWLRFKFKDNEGIQVATAILGPACTMVIAFGFLYGEFFGNLLHAYIVPFNIGPVTLPFNRVDNTMTLLILAIGVGFIQVVLGLALGVINGFKTKHMKHVYEKGGLLLWLVGIAILLAASVLTIAGAEGKLIFQAVGALILLVGLLFAIRGGGILGIVESIGTVANVASYARIMAVGLAGAIFADAANQMTAKVGLVLGILIGIVLQVLNIIIAAFSPNIHAIRLNFLEFFGKFYEGEGKEYQPFHKTGGE